MQQPSDVATGPMALAETSAEVLDRAEPPVAYPQAYPQMPTAGPPPPQASLAPPASQRPRSRREALAAERAGRTGEQSAVLPEPRPQTTSRAAQVLHPDEAPVDHGPVEPSAVAAGPDLEAGDEPEASAAATGTQPRVTGPDIRPEGGARRPSRLGRVLLPVVALVLAMSAVSTLLPGDNSLQVMLAAMAPLGALIAVPVIALAVHHQRRVTAVVAGLAAVLPWALVVGYATAGPQPAADAAPLRVMLVNGNEGQVNAADVVSAIREHGVDVLVVNELTTLLAHDLTGAGIGGALHARYISTSGSPSGEIGVWTRPEVTDAAAVTGTNMPAMTGTVQTDAGAITLIAGHSPRPYPPHAPFAGDAKSWADDLRQLAVAGSGAGPRVLIGDLNATPWNKQFRDLEATSGLNDAANLLGKGLRPTWPVWSPMPLSPVDHVMVGGGIGVTSVGTAIVGGSNHRALVVELGVPRKHQD